MATARTKARTLRQDFDEYEIALSDLLVAANISPSDIVEGDRWRVRVSGGSVVLVRYRSPVVNPTVNDSLETIR